MQYNPYPGIYFDEKREYEYICVLDFEATCDDVKQHMHEVIEFPSVLFRWNDDIKNYDRISHFQKYCKPLQNTKLTPFCTKLTGITQDLTDNGDDFPNVLREHHSWLAEHIGHDMSSCIIMTHGFWDLNVMMPEECKRWGIKPPTIYKRFVNIKLEYGKPGSMVDMLKGFGLELEGRHHSGIDDSHNIGRIMQKIVESRNGDRTFQVILVPSEKYKVAHPNGKKAMYWKSLCQARKGL